MFDPRRYPKNWRSDIRPRILARESHCCKFCGVADKLLGWWVPASRFYSLTEYVLHGAEPGDEDALQEQVNKKPAARRVVLTIAHLDHGLSNHDDSNLAALCQRCHLNHDRDATAAKRGQGKRYGKRRKQLQLQF